MTGSVLFAWFAFDLFSARSLVMSWSLYRGVDNRKKKTPNLCIMNVDGLLRAWTWQQVSRVGMELLPRAATRLQSRSKHLPRKICVHRRDRTRCL